MLGKREGMGGPAAATTRATRARRAVRPRQRAPAPAAQRPAASKPASGFDDMDDDIPF